MRPTDEVTEELLPSDNCRCDERTRVKVQADHKLKQLESIQFLRGIAAISVALVHSASLSGIEGSLNFLSAGVDIFFVISGIVMAISTNENSTPFEFLWRRVTRVVPLYWIFTGLVIAYIKLRYAYIPPIDHILTSLFFLPPAPGQMPILYPGWSLNFEMFFYLMLALCLFVPNALALTAVLTVAFGALGPVTGHAFFDYYMNPHLLEFAAGIVIGKYILSGGTFPKAVGLLAIFSGMVILIIQNEPHSNIAISWGAPSILIVTGILSFEGIALFKYKISGLVGDSSYSIYLVHAFPIWLLDWIFGKQLNIAFILIAVIISIILGIASYRYLEQPLLRGCKSISRLFNSQQRAA